MAPLVVTTSGKSRNATDAVEEAQAAATRLGVEFVPCVKGTPVESLLERADAVLVFRGDGVVLLDAKGSARWTGGMADLRIQRIDRDIPQPDHLLLAGEVRPGDHLLDCTLGRGHDALVLERAVGPKGRVVGLEAALPLYAWTSEGLRRRGSRIEAQRREALPALRALGDATFDCVFFDPMFDKRAHHEAGFALIRRHAEGPMLDEVVLREAQRVARRWVVVKAAPQSGRLWRLGLTTLPFARHAELRFGRIGSASR